MTLFDLPDHSPNGATLHIVPPPQYSYQALPVVIPGPRSRIVYDAERQALYAVRLYEEMIEHFAYVEGTWVALPPRVVLGLSDIAMAADGRALLVIDEHAVYEMSLRDGPSNPVFRVAVPGENCTLERAAAANNGTFFLVGRFNGSGSCTGRIYDARSYTLSSSQRSFTDGVVESSADGRRVYIGSLSTALEVYDSLTGAMSLGPSGGAVQRLSVSGDASRAILNDIYVISSDFASVASLPRRSPGGALASRDSSRVFVYGQGQAGARLDIYGLDVPPLQNGTLALLHSISLPDKASVTGQDAVTMTGTPDDSVVFIAGNSKLLVVPIAASP